MNGDVARLFVSGDWGEQVEEEFVVELYVGDSDGHLLVEFGPNVLEDLRDTPGNQSSVFVVLGASTHRKGLSCSCLSVAEDGPVVPLDYIGNDLPRAGLKNVFLG